jgi:putative peptidoglycan lipid II flippase
MSGTRTVAKAAGLLMLAQLASRILGFFRESLMAGFFGKTGVTDAYQTAFILPDLIYWLLVGGVLSSAFIPVFSEYINRGDEEEG